MCNTPPPVQQQSVAPQSTPSTSPQKFDFIAWYRQWRRTTVNELEEFFSLAQEDFETCDSIAVVGQTTFTVPESVLLCPWHSFYARYILSFCKDVSILWSLFRLRTFCWADILWWKGHHLCQTATWASSEIHPWHYWTLVSHSTSRPVLCNEKWCIYNKYYNINKSHPPYILV